MNDHDAIDAISAVLERLYRCQLNSVEATNEISQIIGLNKIEHEEQK